MKVYEFRTAQELNDFLEHEIGYGTILPVVKTFQEPKTKNWISSINYVVIKE